MPRCALYLAIHTVSHFFTFVSQKPRYFLPFFSFSLQWLPRQPLSQPCTASFLRYAHSFFIVDVWQYIHHYQAATVNILYLTRLVCLDIFARTCHNYIVFESRLLNISERNLSHTLPAWIPHWRASAYCIRQSRRLHSSIHCIQSVQLSEYLLYSLAYSLFFLFLFQTVQFSLQFLCEIYSMRFGDIESGNRENRLNQRRALANNCCQTLPKWVLIK